MATEEIVLEMAVEVDKNNSKSNEGNILIGFLQQNDVERFINYKDGSIEDLVNYSEESHTLLQMCCENGLYHAAIHLLNKGADYEGTSSKNTAKPIIISVEKGYHRIFKALLDKYTQILKLPKNLLTTILQNIKCEDCDNNYECYDAFVKKLIFLNPDEVSFKLNEGDKDGNTALHYAVMYNNTKIIRSLLSLGASLGAKNNKGIMPIKNLDPEILRNYLDDDHGSFGMSEQELILKDAIVAFDYRFLIPPYVQLKNNKGNPNTVAPQKQIVEKKLVAETEVIQFMSKTPEWKELLTHPTITCFLYLKWLQMKWIFWINLACYLLFTGSLLTYFVIDGLTEKSITRNIICIKILEIIISTGSLAIMFRELFQLFVASVQYFMNFENYVEILLVVLSAMVAYNIYFSNETRKDIFAGTILLVAFELVLLLGQHPTFSINVVMFRTICYNYFKFFILYSLPVVAFAVSFNLVFSTNTIANKTANAFDDNGENSFNALPQSVFKTIIMLTGEFDSGNLNFDQFPVTSKLIFTAFVFTMAIILVNLLNGLAVSDIQMIQNNAEVIGYASRVQFIANIETRLIGIPVIKYIQKLIKLWFPLLHISRRSNRRLCQYLSQISCLFPKYFDYKVSFYPKNGGLIKNSNENKYDNVCLDKNTVLRTINLIIQRKSIIESKIRDDFIKSIESQQQLILSHIKLLLDHVGCRDHGFTT